MFHPAGGLPDLSSASIGGGRVNSAPAADHQSGFARRSAASAASAAARSANSAKQVAPLPLIRASSAPGNPAKRSRTAAISGTRRSAAVGQVVAAGRQRRGQSGRVARHRGKPPRSAKTSRRGRETPLGSAARRRGLASTIPAGGRPSAGSSRSPMPPTQTGRAARQAGTSAPSRAASSASAAGASAPPDRWSRTRSAAAASLDPPPIPDAVGSRLSRNSAAPACCWRAGDRGRPRCRAGRRAARDCRRRDRQARPPPGRRPTATAGRPATPRPGRRYRRRPRGCRADDSRRRAARRHAGTN